jgi:hypothetical protein
MPRVQRIIDAFQTGVAQNAQAMGSFLEANTPFKDAGQSLREIADKDYTAPVMSFTDYLAASKPSGLDHESVASWLGNLAANTGQFIAENVANQIPNIAGNYASAAMGAFAGGKAGAVAGPEGAAVGGTLGSLAGIYGYNMFLNAGAHYADLRERGVSREAARTTAGFIGAAKAVLDSALPVKLGGSLAAKLGMNIAWVPKDALNKAPNLAKALLSGSVIGGGTNAGKELLDMLGEMYNKVYTPGEAVARVLNSGVAGAIGGSFFSGAEYAAERGLEKNAQEDPTGAPDPRLTDPGEPAEVPPPSPSISPAEAPSVSELPGVIRQSLMELGGTKALFDSYTEPEVKGILNMGKGASVKPLVRAGLLEEHDGKYSFTKVVNGEGTLMQHENFPGLFYEVSEAKAPTHYIFMDPSVNPEPQRIDVQWANPHLGTEDKFTVNGKSFDFLENAVDYIKESATEGLNSTNEPSIRGEFTPDGKLRAGLDVDSAKQPFRNLLNTTAPALSATKEALQNSIDAVRSVPNGHVNVSLSANEDGTHTLVVEDNGVGMSRELISKAYSSIAEQGEKSSNLENSGGLGVDMAAMLSAGPLKVTTTTKLADGSFERSTFSSTPDSLLKSGVEVQTEHFPASADLQTGTKTEVTLPENSQVSQAHDFLDKLKFSSNLPGTITVNQKPFPGSNVSTNNHQARAPFVEGSRLFSHEVPGIANIDVYGSKERNQESGSGVLDVHVLDNGLYQFTQHIPVKETLGLPTYLSFDVKSKVNPSELKESPFSPNRESLKEHITEALEKLVDKKLIKPGEEQARNLLSHTYENLPPVPGSAVPGLMHSVLFDAGKRLTQEEQTAMLKNPAVTQFTKTLGWVVKSIKDKLVKNPELWRQISNTDSVLGANIERTGILLSEDALGIWLPRPGSDGKATVLINPFWMLDKGNVLAKSDYGFEHPTKDSSYIYTSDDTRVDIQRHEDGKFYLEDNKAEEPVGPFNTLQEAEAAAVKQYNLETEPIVQLSPHQYVASVWETVRHEILHDIWNQKDHGPDFALGSNLLAAMLGEDYNKFQQEIEHALTKRNADGSLEVHPELESALQIYRDSRGRPETEKDLLGGERSGVDDVPQSQGSDGSGQEGDATDLGRRGRSGYDSATTTTGTEIPASDHFATSTIKSFNRMMRNASLDVQKEVRGHLGTLYKLLRHAYFLTQQVEQNPDNPYGKSYMNSMREWVKVRTGILLEADSLNRQWHKFGPEALRNVSQLVREVSTKSDKLGRRLSTDEVLEIAKKFNGNTDRLMEVWSQIDLSMQRALQMLYESLVHEAERTFGMAAPLRIFEIDKEFADLRNRNYFPATRFGKYGIRVVAQENMTWNGESFKKGEPILFETRESERQGLQLKEAIAKEFSGNKVSISERYLSDVEHSFLNMPESLVRLVEDRLGLNEEDLAKLKQLQHELAPGRGFVKHLIKRRGILGASLDVPRVYNDYYRKLSGHIARIETSYMAEEALAGAKQWANEHNSDYRAHYFAEALETHYNDMRNPGNEFGSIAGAIYTLVFGFNPLSAVVNLTQVPVFTYPYLAKRAGDIITTKALAIAMKKVSSSMRPNLFSGSPEERNSVYSGEDRAMFDRAVSDNFLTESMAGEVAAMASGNLLTKYFEHGLALNHYTQMLLGKSVIFHRLSEEFNRRVTFQAALEVGRTLGNRGDALYEFAREAVEKTQFEYSSWNRPHMMRGKASLLFIFKAFLQNFLYFASTNQGGARFWLMLTALGGLRGIPGADDIMDLLELTGTWGKKFLGLENPRVDLRKMANDFTEAVGLNPDLVMNGLSRYSFGLAGLAHLFGIPFPSADFSSSMQISRVIPGIKSLKGTLEGTMKWPDAVAQGVADITGAAGTMGLNFTRAVLEDSPANAGNYWAISSALRNVGKAFEMATTGAYRTPDGRKLVDVDLAKPEQVGEIFMQALGKKPTRVSKIQDANAAIREQMAFYFAWRDTIFSHWAAAIGTKDSEGQAKARKEYRQFAETAPKQFVLTPDQVYQTVYSRVRGRKLQELGLPPQEQFLQIYQDYQNSFDPK